MYENRSLPLRVVRVRRGSTQALQKSSKFRPESEKENYSQIIVFRKKQPSLRRISAQSGARLQSAQADDLAPCRNVYRRARLLIQTQKTELIKIRFYDVFDMNMIICTPKST